MTRHSEILPSLSEGIAWLFETLCECQWKMSDPVHLKHYQSLPGCIFSIKIWPNNVRLYEIQGWVQSMGERCKLPHRGLGWVPRNHHFITLLLSLLHSPPPLLPSPPYPPPSPLLLTVLLPLLKRRPMSTTPPLSESRIWTH